MRQVLDVDFDWNKTAYNLLDETKLGQISGL